MSKFQWVEGTATIITENGPVEVPCCRTCMIPGLAITYTGGGQWSITHERSGSAINGGYFHIRMWAKNFAEEHCSKADWTKAIEDGPPSDDFENALTELQFALMAEEEALEQLGQLLMTVLLSRSNAGRWGKLKTMKLN